MMSPDGAPSRLRTVLVFAILLFIGAKLWGAELSWWWLLIAIPLSYPAHWVDVYLFRSATGAGTKEYDAFQRQLARAEGSPFVRSMIAEAMCTIEEKAVANERSQRPAAQQLD